MSDDSQKILAAFDPNGPRPSFLYRYGPLYEKGEPPPLNMKLCLTATSMSAMARILYELSERPDCFVVKMDEAPLANGMIRGRCFLATKEATAEMWNKYKVTDDVLCSVQDDDFTKDHRIL